MVSITIFNNKGGVGKTTLLCNLASFLQRRENKRVLVIDADPQCNASIYVTSNDELESIYTKSSSKTIYDIIKPLQRGSDFIKSNNIPIVKNEKFGFDIIYGDTKLSLAEDFLSSDWIDGKNGGPRGLKTTFVFKHLLQKLENRYDYVFFDVGPSLGAITRCVLLSCDFFLIPMSSDIFSLKAIENISKSLDNWISFVSKGLDEFAQNDGESFMIDNEKINVNVRFLGYIYQQYTAKTTDGIKRPVKAYDTIISKMNATISRKLCHFYESFLTEDDLLIGEIPTLNSLIPLSQIANKPIFELSSGDGVVGAHFSKIKEYESVINDIVSKVKRNIFIYGMA